MFVIFENKKCQFFPLVTPVIIVESLDRRPLAELPENVYGKAFWLGAWVYNTWPKDQIKVCLNGQ